VKKGPRTVDSVAPGGLALFIESTRVEAPNVSERRINSAFVIRVQY
jgi:hypothetical protein